MIEATNLITGLNPMQKEAVVTTDGPLSIVAGAGSGKTRVLTHRVAYLLLEKRILPWNILAITFTNKAAREMRERIHHLIGHEAEDIWISTFHAMCVRILRRDIDRIGYSRNFTILDSTDQRTVMKQVLKKLDLDPKKYEPRKLLAQVSKAKNELKRPQDLREGAQSYLDEMTASIYESYQQTLRSNQSLDFDDLLVETVRLFQQIPEVLDYYQRKFQFIHVDEYQDTNHVQYSLVKLLAARHRNICVVGDSDQSIYRFRGADISNILNFERDYPDATVIKLEQNYRSTKMILEAANQVISRNRQRKPKELWTENQEGKPVVLFEAGNEHEEAYFIADTIVNQARSTGKYSNFAILYRTNAQSRVIEEVLVKSNIPYQVVGGIKFYERKEIKDLLAYLRLVVNPDDDISLNRVINVPRRGIGQGTMEKITIYAQKQGLSLFQALKRAEEIGLTARFQSAIHSFVSLISQLHATAEYLSAVELIEEVLQRSGYREELKKEGTIEAAGRLENLEEFLSVGQEYEQKNEDKSLIGFLTELALVADVDTLDEEGEDKGESVTLMTLHSAKGLEFPYVFLAGMEEKLFPHIRSLEEEDEMEEERRLAYVGITRAEKQLYLTRADSRMLFGQTQSNLPSRFLAEIPDILMERVNKRGASASKSPSTTRMQKPRRPQKNETTKWYVGDKVSHGKWGEGTVVKVQPDGDEVELNIAFPAPVGVKRLLARYAPIEKVNS
ncbi:DNA helicase PcrA [Mechercharimyces sp. CAU 1602]|uniref:DNA helicase PcrA n=1 Tax=Mechercharimyces sp. CAU 1602 TaxID=2973933 RepID=UPI0021624CC0|nr:DNA helicase PcrA [Mechercharimyces sp. CAU 1602]MCS1351995.1 DNA helicase PcrA [Mechercharimyces sp. CAU 1602]